MSRSKRAAQGRTAPAPRRDNRISSADNGGLRIGWLLAASLLAYALVALATRYGLIRAFAALFQAWGVDASNVYRAPAWARAVFLWHGSLTTLAFAALALLLAGWLRKLWRLEGTLFKPPSRRLLWATLAGVLAALAVAALSLLPDSMRLEWPLTAPRLTWTLPVMAVVSLISAVAEETFTKRVLYEGLRGRWNGLWTGVVVCAVLWLTNGGLTAGIIGTVNALLLGCLGCVLYAQHGIWTAVGFRWGWSLANVFFLGFGGGDASFYRLYGVSEALLTGGDAGPMHGLWTTLLLMIINVVLIRKAQSKNDKEIPHN